MINFLPLIEKHNKIFVTTHINPDADAICSGLALIDSLKQLFKDKEIRFFVDSEISDNLSFIKGVESVEMFDNSCRECDLLIVLDAPSLDRVGRCGSIISKDSINIDHHLGNDMFGTINIVDTSFSSTCEAVYLIIEANKMPISKDICNNIYAGIVADTGNMLWGNISENTFRIVYELKRKNIDNIEISKEIFLTRSREQILILQYLIGNLKIVNDICIYSFLPFKELKRMNANINDTEGVVDILKSLKDVKLAFLLKEQEDGKIRCSLRSDIIDVNRLAKEFGGGGHRAASGFTILMSEKEIIKKIIEFVRVK